MGSHGIVALGFAKQKGQDKDRGDPGSEAKGRVLSLLHGTFAFFALGSARKASSYLGMLAATVALVADAALLVLGHEPARD